MNTPHTTISHSLIRGILFAAILCLLFTGTAGADDSPYLNINVPTTIFPEYPATAVFTFSSSGCTDLKVNYGDGTGEVELTATSQTVTHTYTQPGTSTDTIISLLTRSQEPSRRTTPSIR